jgi:hypothetical protein
VKLINTYAISLQVCWIQRRRRWATLARSTIYIAEFYELLEKITDMAQDASEAGILAEDEAALYLQAKTAAVRASRG